MLAGRLKPTHTHAHTQGRQTAQFSVQYVLCHAVAKPCSQQLFNKQSYKNLHTCQSCFWCSVAWRHDWTPHHIFLQKYAEPLIGRTCSPKLQGKKYCVYIFFSVCGANLTAAANLRLIIPLILQWVPPSLFHSWLCSPPSAALQLPLCCSKRNPWHSGVLIRWSGWPAHPCRGPAQLHHSAEKHRRRKVTIATLQRHLGFALKRFNTSVTIKWNELIKMTLYS